MRLFYDMKSKWYNEFKLKIPITNTSIEHYMRVLLDNNKKQNKQKTKNIIWKIVLSSFSIFHAKNYTGQNNTF